MINLTLGLEAVKDWVFEVNIGRNMWGDRILPGIYGISEFEVFIW
jgi:hypothetical protein